MKIRTIALVAVAASPLLSLPASARPAPAAKPRIAKPACPLLTDPVGDARYLPVPVAVPARALDITAADIGIGRKTLVTHISVDSLSADDLSQAGGRWEFHWTVEDVATDFVTVVEREATGRTSFTYSGRPAGGTEVTGEASGSFGTDTDQIRVILPIAALDRVAGRSSHVVGYTVTNLRVVTTAPLTGAVVDEAASDVGFVIGSARTCSPRLVKFRGKS